MGCYVPAGRVSNDDLARLTGKDPNWFETRTGIRTRARAERDETTSGMACDAVRDLLVRNPRALEGVDLILAGSYTPNDTLATIAHRVQREFNIQGANAMYLSTACTSFVTCLEVAQAYLTTEKASKVLIVVAEHNSLFSSDADPFSGHLWGDGAAAVIVEQTALPTTRLQICGLESSGLGTEGSGADALGLDISSRVINMPNGKEVFTLACQHMAKAVRQILSNHKCSLDELLAIVAHQANVRIIKHVAKDLGMPLDLFPATIAEWGNTGCASIPLTLARWDACRTEDGWLVCVAFGGGYSCGSLLVRAMNSGSAS
jgi:3-oxoacyl-[acyl-carrier-protein] synthase-3|tara:strand:+ start:30308 stop:31258 length:951 start_codon:yes stop_codon:yes gene_type:complete